MVRSRFVSRPDETLIGSGLLPSQGIPHFTQNDNLANQNNSKF